MARSVQILRHQKPEIPEREAAPDAPPAPPELEVAIQMMPGKANRLRRDVLALLKAHFTGGMADI
ncbi:MAG: hypothetical protein GDA39_10385, partial [Hyphomonadaceae bacterium]|nr:hypothetical protein [Hyphomonadaceae bacterium]